MKFDATACARGVAGMLLVGLAMYAGDGRAYGTEGHLIAGRAAESGLCTEARRTVARLGNGDDLGELGLWADRIRSDPARDDTGPWHYMNIDDGEPVAAFVHPPEGDVLWAVGHFARQLADEGLDDATRGEALRFLVHFVVDLHQPLHVGRASDRGGNSIRLRFRGETTNLHRYWDSHAIDWADESVGRYTRAVRLLVPSIDGGDILDPEVWATESQALRASVYDFGRANREPRRAYAERAAAITRERLALAAARLAATLNSLLCAP